MKKINNQSKTEIINRLYFLDEQASLLLNAVTENFGKDPVIYRRVRGVSEKINDLIWLVQEK
jgi:hypothetical protein